MNKHFFDVEIACLLGQTKAVLLENISFWIKHNKANNTNFYDGEYWTYNSAKAFNELFPYMSESTIQKSLKQLINDGYLLKGNYNKKKYDKTIWYAFTEKTKKLYKLDSKIVLENEKSDSFESDTNKNNVPATYNSIAELENFFNSVWQELPSKMKKGKSAVKKTQRIKLMKVGTERLNQCLKLYLLEVKNEKKFMLNGSTWFNGRYEDYIEQVQKQRVVKREVEYKTEDMIEKEFINLYMKKNIEKYNDRVELNLKAQEEWIEIRINIIKKYKNETGNNISSENLLNKLIKKFEEYKNE